MKQLSCDQCRERWDELIHKSTFEADSQFADVRAHLESCADCRKIFELLAATRQELQELPAQKAPASLRANILNQIEKPQEQHIPWWRSFLVSPQHLAWASGAIVAVFVVALLMRPEHQTPVMQIAPKVLTNRGQVEEHNSAPPQVSISPSKPKGDLPAKDLSAEKVLPEKPLAKPLEKAPKVKLQTKTRAKLGATKKTKQQQKLVTPALESASDKKRELPAPNPNRQLSTMQSQQKSEQQKNPPQHLAPPAPIMSDSAANEPRTNEKDGIAKSYSQNSANQQDSMNRSAARALRASEVPAGAIQKFKVQKVPVTIHWSKTITSDYDVANAEITVTLQNGLAFADDTPSHVKRTWWRGTLHRGKQIPLEIDLHRTSENDAKLHVLMIDSDTGKVLLDKNFKLP